MKYWKLSLLLLAGLSCSLAKAMPLPCDNELKADSNSTGYKVRETGVRCEGFYIAKVSKNARDLALVALTRGSLHFDSGNTVELKSGLPGRTILIRGVGITEKTYYRLDGIIRRDKSFIWRLDEVVHKRKLRANDIGLTGYYDISGRNERIYVPIGVGSGDDTTIRIVGAERFSKAWWRYTSLTDGACGKMPEWAPLTTPEFEDDPMVIILPKTVSLQICLEVTALPTVGNDWRPGRWKIRSKQ